MTQSYLSFLRDRGAAEMNLESHYAPPCLSLHTPPRQKVYKYPFGDIQSLPCRNVNLPHIKTPEHSIDPYLPSLYPLGTLLPEGKFITLL